MKLLAIYCQRIYSQPYTQDNNAENFYIWKLFIELRSLNTVTKDSMSVIALTCCANLIVVLACHENKAMISSQTAGLLSYSKVHT